MKQIKRLIEEQKKKPAKGQLYGLWTHSYQPVIQYVIGDPNPNESKEVKEHLENFHGLKHVGNWGTVDGGKESKLKRKATYADPEIHFRLLDPCAPCFLSFR